jgi:hypothetical protein
LRDLLSNTKKEQQETGQEKKGYSKSNCYWARVGRISQRVTNRLGVGDEKHSNGCTNELSLKEREKKKRFSTNK